MPGALVEVIVASWILAALVAAGLWLGRARRADTHLRAWTWALLVSAALPLLGTVDNLGFSGTAAGMASAAADGGRVLGAPVRLAASAATAATPGPWPWLAIIYIAVSVMLLVREGIGARLATRLAGSASAVPGRGFFESDRVTMPLTVGLLSPRIVLPAGWRSWPETTLDAVLAHEQGHVTRRDGLRVAGARVYRSVCWPNPLAWWLTRHMTVLADRASDELAIERGVPAADYADTLLQFAVARPAPGRRVVWSLPMADGARSRIERRIDHVLSWKGIRPMSRVSRVLVAFAIVSLGMVVQAGQAPQPQRVADVPATVALDHAPHSPEAAVAITATTHTNEHGGYTSVSLLNQTDRAVRAVTFALSIGTRAQETLQPLRTVRVEVDIPAHTLRTVDVRLVPTAELKRIAQESGSARLELSIASVEYATADIAGTVDTRAARGGGAGESQGGNEGPRREPVLLSLSHPKYTPEAMRQKIQGVVELELDIDDTGRVAAARVVKSLDSLYGLDDQAIAAALETRFMPATVGGEAVATTVKFQMEFKVH